MELRLSKIVFSFRRIIGVCRVYCTKRRERQRGQMAIFVALIFQILFLFFAMAINIGLAVHDKINLQNAVDLAAYYMAQKQAEQLNVIAHTNYQIRQAWKLLNWRYYVLGTMGREVPRPAPKDPSNQYPRVEGLDPGVEIPVVCVTSHNPWQGMGVGQNDNMCKDSTRNYPNIRPPGVIAPFLPFNILFDSVARNLASRIAQNCDQYAGVNWWFAANIYSAFMFDQAGRKELIRALAKNLGKPPEQMIDLNGDTVAEGATQTFKKNLTKKNEETLTEIKLFNSMSVVGDDYNKWLNDLEIWFSMAWQDATSSSSSCDAKSMDIKDFPSGAKLNYLNQTFGAKNVQIMQALIANSAGIQAGNSNRLALGVEKNPWYLVYSGFRAKSKPRQIFFPFGEPVEFEAVAYASPFGGRIGPWYGSYWPSGAASSAGDPSQNVPQKLVANGVMNTGDIKKMMPKYGRFPGDNLGLTSFLAQVAFTGQTTGMRAEHKDYADIVSNIGEGLSNDLLPALNPDPNVNVRDYEIAAITPDLFDITYYSIEPDFDGVYLPRIRNRSVYQILGLTGQKFPRGDLGSFDANGKHNKFSVKDQMARSRAMGQAQIDLIQPDLFWVVKDRAHLLTSWVHNEVYGVYNFTPQETVRFGKCKEWDDKFPDDLKIEGSCVDGGGRTGYSVKIVSGDYLRSALPLGGQGQSAAPILNPPPTTW